MAFRVLFLSIFFLFPSLIHGQAYTDSLIAELPAVQDSSAKLEILEELYNELIYSDPEVGIVFSRQALQIARSLNKPESEVNALLSISWVYTNLEYNRVAMDICLQAIEICKERNIPRLLGNCYNTLGMIEYSREEYDSSIVCFKRSADIRRDEGEVERLGSSYNNIGRVLIEKRDFAAAKPVIKQALALNRKYDRVRWALMGLGNLAEIALEEKEFDSIVYYLDEAEALAGDDFPDTDQWFLRLRASRERQIGSPKKARSMLFDLIDQMAKKGNQIESWKPYLELANLEEEVGNVEKANEYLHQVNHLKDSIHKVKQSDQMAAAMMFNRIKLKEREEELRLEQAVQIKEGELARTKLISGFFLMGAIFLMVLVVVFFLRNREQRKLSFKLKNEVENQTEELVRANEELNTFIYQSSHYLRGPISTIQGLHKLMMMGGLDPVKATELLGQKLEQLDKGQRSLVYTMELRNRDVRKEKISVLESVESSIERISSHQGTDEVEFRLEIDETIEFSTDKWIFGLILDHLIENAVVYREPSRESWCRIAATSQGNTITLLIEDNGIGMPNEVQEQANKMFFRGDHIHTGNGLGLYNVQMGLETLGGEIRIQGEVGHGTLIQLIFSGQKSS